MLDIATMQSQGLRKAAEARQCVAGLYPLNKVPGRPLHEAVRVKVKRLWGFQDGVAERTIG